jgi:hypothetical protein
MVISLRFMVCWDWEAGLYPVELEWKRGTGGRVEFRVENDRLLVKAWVELEAECA